MGASTNLAGSRGSSAIRSFVRRRGRMTAAQRRALNELWPKYGVGYAPAPLNLEDLFGREAPRVLEIGFGNGDALVAQAGQNPDLDFLGIEVHEPGIGHCLLEANRQGVENLRLIQHDAVDVIRDQIPNGSLRSINLFYPDPWPKKRHHKRRLVQPEFMALVTASLEPGGCLHTVTDWPDYAEHIASVVDNNPLMVPISMPQPQRLRTRFEARGEALGHDRYEQVYQRMLNVPNAGEKEYK
ncbi:MAG: tRNA (guanosine(46)-N7)-methyltransferase TrmB [Gammaproteobacteria bacterium]|nr:tRNA (guanosine(46)-N7)-methyltransferase TrmB [Gammaproteobacteria bacterium]